MNKKILLLISCLIITACNPPKEHAYDVTMAQRIRWANVDTLKEQGFRYIGGSNAENPTLYKLEDHYYTTKYQLASVNDAREVFCNFFELYIKPFNTAPQIRHYIHEYPLTGNNVSLLLYFWDDNHDRLLAPYICSINNKDGYIFYMIKDDEATPPRVLHKEPFATALELVKGAN